MTSFCVDFSARTAAAGKNCTSNERSCPAQSINTIPQCPIATTVQRKRRRNCRFSDFPIETQRCLSTNTANRSPNPRHVGTLVRYLPRSNAPLTPLKFLKLPCMSGLDLGLGLLEREHIHRPEKRTTTPVDHDAPAVISWDFSASTSTTSSAAVWYSPPRNTLSCTAPL
jgi:hypothetical protein